ncbi:Stp1/IreP family PP2C-type Ser/Thr phosphatase [Desulfonatronum thiodismutans]|uniref:Stp1/IreP family PP2C-type Ser/Thr phosphatase n=1 Tax=Desulfonatronum thiodismutans TaxID=159290 RepID=UPI00068D6B6D|nr:Stp1/IreP family PP2C-type Ser/Thr phosphatase [Desulfonatronum thiodismutans]
MSNLSYTGMTHQGQVRGDNQDSIYLPQGGCSLPCLFLVADGMGGANGGKTASELAVSIVSEEFHQNQRKHGPELALRNAVKKANSTIYYKAQAEQDLRGMGTTLIGLAVLSDNRALIINVGDSRCYLLREGELHQLSEDHSVVQEMVREGKLTDEQARSNGMRNMLSRAVGAAAEVKEDLFAVTALEINDTFLLCSDGLHGPVPEERIRETLQQSLDISGKAQQLLRLANDNGGPDNISVILVRVNQSEYLPEPDEVTFRKNVPMTKKQTGATSSLSGFLGRFFNK